MTKIKFIILYFQLQPCCCQPIFFLCQMFLLTGRHHQYFPSTLLLQFGNSKIYFKLFWQAILHSTKIWNKRWHELKKRYFLSGRIFYDRGMRYQDIWAALLSVSTAIHIQQSAVISSNPGAAAVFNSITGCYSSASSACSASQLELFLKSTMSQT